MNEVVQELLWWVFTRMIAPLLLLFILVQLWQNDQDKTTTPESTKSRQVKLDDRTLFTLDRLNKEGKKAVDISDYPTALKKWEQGLNLARQAKNQQAIGAFLGNIGLVYKNLGDYPKALDYLKQALKIKKEISDRSGEGADLNNIGMVYQNFGEYQKAKEAFQDSIDIKKNIGAREPWKAQRGLASTEAKLNQPEPAIQHYEQAIDNIEKIRNLLTKEHKTSFMRGKLYVYDELIAFLQSLHPAQPKKGYARKAFETFERKQGRLFLEEMGQSGARRFAGLDNEILEAEQALTLKLQQAQSLSPQKRTALEQAEVQLEARIKTEYPKYYALKYPQPVDLATLQNQVLQKGEVTQLFSPFLLKPSKKCWHKPNNLMAPIIARITYRFRTSLIC
jgi:tetratricopeptide (TPR) repeat protein